MESRFHLIFSEGHSFPKINGGCFVVEANDNEFHIR